ncbi:hypothetical protein HYALB_00008566 [Hymenoscyphus albidus]|uniref:Uncharacterized protein n=1 Tax=Hymenoscyphus albidus TaxID=595503 RepID=A0A9N9LK53_9HELO|nr:hypothetical protein HYALB_00008566 [Hymenoscyphus albidus]
MAPDLNSVPASPRTLADATSPRITSRNTPRRASQQMAPPALPPTSLNILPSNQSAVNHIGSPPLTSPTMPYTSMTAAPVGDNTGVGTGPGPLRHPRPLTAADLHLQLEKEQEAVVNRLTRELSMLRAAQNASVVSNASSTSTGIPDSTDTNANHLLSGPSHPQPSQRRHQRSSSSTSTRSIPIGTTSVTNLAPSSTLDRTRGNPHRQDSIPQSHALSRQNSMTSSRRSGASSPAPLSSSYTHPDHFPHFYQQRPSLTSHQRDPSYTNLHASIAHNNENVNPNLRSDSITSVPTTGRYEETAFHRHELDSVKRENELLKRRIRELERTLRARRPSDANRPADARRPSDASRTRSESVSTTASVRDNTAAGLGIGNGRGREREKEGEEDSVRVGESARSSGVVR